MTNASTDAMSATDQSNVMDPERYARIASQIEAAVATRIVGQHDVVRTVVTALLSEGHVLLEGVPGLGKTYLLRTLADAIGLEFGRIQFTPDLMPADVTGTQVLEQDATGRRDFVFRQGPVFAGLVLADEINRATPKTQSALLEAMQERSVTVAGESYELPRPFLVMATQNPLEQEGTYPLPEAQLDRFMFKADVPFPSAEELVGIVTTTTDDRSIETPQVTGASELAAMIRLTRLVPASTDVVRHAVDLVVATHPSGDTAPNLVGRYVRSGASPRGAQALILGAKATALIDGRPSPSCEDVRSLAVPALAHRLVLGYEAVADGVSSHQLVESVLDAVPAPSSGVRGGP